MSSLFTQSYDIIQGMETAYAEFIAGTFLPAMEAIGFPAVGGYYVEVGSGPRIVGVHRAESSDRIWDSIRKKEFRHLLLQLKPLICNYQTAVLEPAGKAKYVEYVIQKGVWKFQQHYDLRPGIKKEYADFIVNEYIPALQNLDYVEVTGGWNVVLGGTKEIIGELTFNDAVDVGRMLNSQEYRRVNDRLLEEFVINYENKILRCTERFHEPRWFRL